MPTLLALVGVQSNQIHRALDLAAYARSRGLRHCVLGGSHAMTCDTSAFQGRGVSIAASEAETVWEEILSDAIHDSMKSVYGRDTRWQSQLSNVIVKPPDAPDLLQAIIDEKLDMRFFIQCDTQIAQQPELVAQLKKAGCFQIFIGVESLDRKVLLGARKGHNHPSRYQRIVELCRENGIMTHFSSMLGFPEHTMQGIDEHVQGICDLDPDVVSFYVLTPIPGTEQYADFRKAGLLTEPNLDRYDTTYPTWKHPHISTKDLYNSLFMAYRRFYSLKHFTKYVRRHFEWTLPSVYFSMYPLFNLFCS